MSRALALVLSFCLPLLLLNNPGAAKNPKSIKEKCAVVIVKPANECASTAAQNLKGALGEKEFTAIELGLKKDLDATTFWYDTDGVDPGVAGCHIGVTDGSDKKKRNGRTFGEACIDNVLLIESNPGANVVHPHKGDDGHPDLFNCSIWCKGRGKTSGRCVKVATGLKGCAASARCACN